jgi:hypothetical protein
MVMNLLKLILMLALLFSYQTIAKDEFTFEKGYQQGCYGPDCNYQTYWSRDNALTEIGIPPPPPIQVDVDEATAASGLCLRILPSRYSETEAPDETLKWLILVECMNSKGWYLKVLPYNTWLQ